MKSQEEFICESSEYFVYSPSKTALDVFLYPMQCGHFLYEPDYFLRRDTYDSFLLMYIQKGELDLEIKGRKYHVRSKLTIKNLCFQTGLSCESIFCSTFKRRLGMTPSQYRTLG